MTGQVRYGGKQGSLMSSNFKWMEGVDGREWLSLFLILVVFMNTIYNCCLCHYHWALCSVICFLVKALHYMYSLSWKRMQRFVNSIIHGIEALLNWGSFHLHIGEVFPLMIHHLVIYIPFQSATLIMITSPAPPQLGCIPFEGIHPLLNPICLIPSCLLDRRVAPYASSPLSGWYDCCCPRSISACPKLPLWGHQGCRKMLCNFICPTGQPASLYVRMKYLSASLRFRSLIILPDQFPTVFQQRFGLIKKSLAFPGSGNLTGQTSDWTLVPSLLRRYKPPLTAMSVWKSFFSIPGKTGLIEYRAQWQYQKWQVVFIIPTPIKIKHRDESVAIGKLPWWHERR